MQEYTVTELAGLFEVSVRTLRSRVIARHVGRKSGKTWLISEDETVVLYDKGARGNPQWVKRPKVVDSTGA